MRHKLHSIAVYDFALVLSEAHCAVGRQRGLTHSRRGCGGVRISELKRSFVA
jgi:hypothetical protein